MKGGAVIVRPKFSASKFWDEAVEYKATLFMYVGELCRFLLAAPTSPNERKHTIRFIIGNGLREEVWRSFTARFNIPAVLEFYGATEGNVSLINVNGRVGAIGRVPDYLKSRFNIEVVAHDVESGKIPRHSDGFCRLAAPDEVGELLGEIRPDDARFRYDGYEDAEATKKKILRNVRKKGDMYFRTGDLVRRDKLGYIYFVDRIGDTYRWKAENVATGEVAAAIGSFTGIEQANVYGVKVPGADGRAGMASIVASGTIDLPGLYSHVVSALPHYARPVFLRIARESDTTGTFKFKKTDLVKDGFDPARISDPLYVANPISGAYERIDDDLFIKINAGQLRL
jgi:fatty-acyl-CoA synthase